MLDQLALPCPLESAVGPMTLRNANGDDLDAITTLLADDPISAGRGDVDSQDDRHSYQSALEVITSDSSNALLVVVDGSDEVVATMQLTRIPGMARRGATRLLIEAVRVASAQRSNGIGAAMMRWAMHDAPRALECGLVQLTSDSARTDAHRFYQRLGFVASHTGFKFHTDSRP